MRERWKPVHGWSLYEASSLGHTRRRGKTVPLCPFSNKNRYLFVHFCVNGIRHTVGVHQAVALAFIGPCPPGKEVGHKDHDRRNNVPSNLKYLTRLENVRQTVDAGRSNRGERHGHAKLTEATVRHIRRLAEAHVPQMEIALHCGIAFQTVSKIIRRERWGWL